MYSTGCRIGEAVNLDKHSINMAEQSVIVFGKGKKKEKCILILDVVFG
jgi:integrase/recombinase XerD